MNFKQNKKNKLYKEETENICKQKKNCNRWNKLKMLLSILMKKMKTLLLILTLIDKKQNNCFPEQTLLTLIEIKKISQATHLPHILIINNFYQESKILMNHLKILPTLIKINYPLDLDKKTLFSYLQKIQKKN